MVADQWQWSLTPNDRGNSNKSDDGESKRQSVGSWEISKVSTNGEKN